MENFVKLDDIEGTHSDERRDLTPWFNGDFLAKQVKIANIKKDAILGGHYHKYAELFTVLSGEAIFKVFNLNDPDKTIQEYKIIPGKKLFIPAQHPHEAKVKAGTILIGATEKEYISPQENDIPYPFPNLEDK